MRAPRLLPTFALTGLALLFGCGSGPGGGTLGTAGGTVNMAVTDAPSDNWQEVSVVLQSASLVPQGATTPVQIWPAGGAASTATVNLVDLSNVASILGSVSVQPGTYSTLQLAINTDPTTMTLVDDGGNTIPAADLTVKGSGTISVDLSPALVVTTGGTTTLQADFNLADPLSIVETSLGGATKVVMDLQVRFKPLPARLQDLQFARKLGQVTAATASGFTLTDSKGHAFTYGVDANTIYWDADTKAAGSFSGIVPNVYALVASNLNSDGTLYARRVWYAAAAATLPTWSPEGLVRRVNPLMDSFAIYAPNAGPSATAAAWMLKTVKVDANTAWTFHTDVAMGTGTAFLADIWRGVRVDVTMAADGVTAATVNVQSAYDEGFVGGATTTGITFGFVPFATNPPPMAVGVNCGLGDLAPRTWDYYVNASDASNAFSWWYFGLPSSTDAAPADLVSVLSAAQGARLPVTAYAGLYWDTVSSTWQVNRLILEPERLQTSVISSAFTDGGNGSGTMGVICLSPFNNFSTTLVSPLTVTLDYAGDLQTVVSSASYTKASNTFTYIFPVPEAQWSTLLVPPAQGTNSLDQIWVRPVLNTTLTPSTINWHAYTVQQFSWQ